jgi:hypothetical protein
MVSFILLPIYPRGRRPRYTVDRWVGGPKNRSDRREKKNLASTGTRTMTARLQSPKLVAIPTVLSRIKK